MTEPNRRNNTGMKVGSIESFGRSIVKNLLLTVLIFPAMSWAMFECDDSCKQLAEEGSTLHQGLLAGSYYYGEGRPQNYYEACKWYRMAAENDFVAQSSLGECYETGLGLEKNLVKAVEWYRRSAFNGFTSPMHRLVSIHMDINSDLNRDWDAIGSLPLWSYKEAYIWSSILLAMGEDHYRQVLPIIEEAQMISCRDDQECKDFFRNRTLLNWQFWATKRYEQINHLPEGGYNMSEHMEKGKEQPVPEYEPRSEHGVWGFPPHYSE